MAKDDPVTLRIRASWVLGMRKKEDQEVKQLVQGHSAQGQQNQGSSIMAQVVSNVLEPSLVYTASWTYRHLFYIIHNGCN